MRENVTHRWSTSVLATASKLWRTRKSAPPRYGLRPCRARAPEPPASRSEPYMICNEQESAFSPKNFHSRDEQIKVGWASCPAALRQSFLRHSSQPSFLVDPTAEW
jgi:hypothetical protein